MLKIRKPDDFHLHLRDGDILKSVIGASSRTFARALVMPNLKHPIRTKIEARSYKARILQNIAKGHDFTPLMTLYLTEESSAQDIVEAYLTEDVLAVKLYPAGATTNSAYGVKKIEAVYHIFDHMSEIGMPLCIHGEVTDPEIDIYDREERFIETVLHPLRDRFPKLKIILEHITTEGAATYVEQAQSPYLAATITPHHLWINRTDMFKGGIRPHLYCLPIAKREHHRQALIQAAISGKECFFAGTDSAPHLRSQKETNCGCAGIFCAEHAVSLYAEIFEAHGALSKLEAFLSENGARYYGLPLNESWITLTQQEVVIPKGLFIDGIGDVAYFRSGEPSLWQVSA